MMQRVLRGGGAWFFPAGSIFTDENREKFDDSIVDLNTNGTRLKDLAREDDVAARGGARRAADQEILRAVEKIDNEHERKR